MQSIATTMDSVGYNVTPYSCFRIEDIRKKKEKGSYERNFSSGVRDFGAHSTPSGKALMKLSCFSYVFVLIAPPIRTHPLAWC